MRSVLFVTEGGTSAQGWYRCRLPALGLQRRHWATAVCGGMVARPDGRLRGLIDPRTGELSPTPEIVVVRMLAHPDGPDLIAKARAAGQRVFYDIDDPIWLTPADHPGAAYDAHDLARANMEACDGVLVSTPGVGFMVGEHAEVRGVHLCRNGIDLRAFPPPDLARAPRVPFRLGWMGRTTHRGRDIETIARPLGRVLEILPGSVIWHLGHVEGDPPLADLIHVPAGRIVVQPWVPIESLPDALAKMDGAVIPQRVDPFALARSATTGLAMAAAGVPYLATATPEYEQLDPLRSLHDGAWFDALIDVVTTATIDPLRFAAWRTNVRAVAARFDIAHTVIGWLEAFG